jgi:hypothetical protein
MDKGPRLGVVAKTSVRGRSPGIAGLALVLGLACGCFPSTARAQPLVPFAQTGDLFVLDDGSTSILRITPAGAVAVAVTRAEILAATGRSSAGLVDRGLAFDGAGNLYFSESTADAVLKRTAGGVLSVLTPSAAIRQATGASSANPKALAFGSDGSLFVNDNTTNSVLKINPATGAVSVHTAAAAFLSVPGITAVDLAGGLVGAPGGVLYTPSNGTPEALFAISASGTPSVLASGTPPFADLHVFLTRAANGDLIVVDDADPSRVHRVTPGGMVSTFLTAAQLETIAGAGNNDLEGGIAFDSLGNFFLAEEDSASILKFDSALQGTRFVTAAQIQAVTGVPPDLEGGIAFAPAPVVPEPGGLVLFSLGFLGCLASAVRAGWGATRAPPGAEC